MAIGESELQRIGDYVRGNLHTWLLEAPPSVAVGRDLVETQVRLQQELKHLRETMENRFAASPQHVVAPKTEDEARELVAIRIYLDELERDEDPVAESAVVNHYTVSD